MTTWGELWTEATAGVGSRHEARRLVERASGYDGAELVLHLGEAAPERAGVHVRAMVERRCGGEPLQYVVGRWGFRTLDLFVDRRVLIPRPETEVVVEVALAALAALAGLPDAAGGRRRPQVVDLGTGSGAIALSVAAEVPRARVWATDVSAGALAVARANLAGLGSRAGPRVRMCQGDWFAALPGELAGWIDLVVCNPPYVAEGEELPAEVAGWEPRRSLVAGPRGTEAVEAVVGSAPRWLARPGVLVVEVAPHQAEVAVALAREAGLVDVEVHPDLAGRPRALVASAR